MRLIHLAPTPQRWQHVQQLLAALCLSSIVLMAAFASAQTKETPTMSAAKATITVEVVVNFLHHFEAVGMQEDFALLRDMIHEHAVFRFNDGDFVGRAAIQAAFEKTWRGDPSVKKARFFLSDIAVLSIDAASATATYTYNWQGSQGGREFSIKGRGTRVLLHENGNFRIVHEHLSRFPTLPPTSK